MAVRQAWKGVEVIDGPAVQAEEEASQCDAVGDDEDVVRAGVLVEQPAERAQEVDHAVVDVRAGLSVREAVEEGPVAPPCVAVGLRFQHAGKVSAVLFAKTRILVVEHGGVPHLFHDAIPCLQRPKIGRHVDAVGLVPDDAGDLLTDFARLGLPFLRQFDFVVRHPAVHGRVVVGLRASMADEDDSFRYHCRSFVFVG